MNNKLKAVAYTTKVESAIAGRIHHVLLDKYTENGELILPGEVDPENLDVREGIVPEEGATGVAFISDVTKGEDCLLNGQDENQYYMEEGHVARAYKIVPTDIISVTKAGFENPELLKGFTAGEDEVFATVGAEGKMKLVEEAPEEGFYAKVISVVTRKGIASAIIQNKKYGVTEEVVHLDVKSN